MKMSALAKAVLAVGVLIGLLAYGIVVELGITAGRIHPGVYVKDVAVGGLIELEAARRLEERAEELVHAPVLPVAEGFDCRFTPDELGWEAKPFETARRALNVGRRDAPFGALVDRWQAWTQGVRVKWVFSLDAEEVDVLLDRCERLAEALGYSIDRPRFRYLIKRAIVTWPRDTFEIPMINA